MSDPATGFEFVRWVARTLGAMNDSGQALVLTFLEDLTSYAGLWNCAATARRLKQAKILSVERKHRADAHHRMAEAARIWAEQAKLAAEADRTSAEADHIRAQVSSPQAESHAGGLAAVDKKPVEALVPTDSEREKRAAAARIQEAIATIRAMGGEVMIEVKLPDAKPSN